MRNAAVKLPKLVQGGVLVCFRCLARREPSGGSRPVTVHGLSAASHARHEGIRSESAGVDLQAHPPPGKPWVLEDRCLELGSRCEI